MKVATFNGVVENGRILLTEDVKLPDKTKVFVVVPDFEVKPVARIVSPRLSNPEDASFFKKEVELVNEEKDDA